MRLLFFLISPLFFLQSAAGPSWAQQHTKPKVILITLDGYRWQELFTGADAELIAHEAYVADSTALKAQFWRPTAKERRQVLTPFIWNDIAAMGTIYGNRTLGNKVNVRNGMRFSYPGYNEILTGAPDDERIDSNEKVPNPNRTILEKLNQTEAYAGQVAAFASWDVFPYIINEARSGVPVNAGFDTSRAAHPTPIEAFLNKAQPRTPSPWGAVRLDVFTHNYALEYMKRAHPDVVYIGYGETDDFGHDGNYEAYLKSAHSTDAFLRELWEYTQQDPYYRNNTTFIVTTDHGRGTQPLDEWRSHGTSTAGADEVWLMVYGARAPAKGEVTADEQHYSTDVVPMIEKSTRGE